MGKRTLGRPKHRCLDNIKMHFRAFNIDEIKVNEVGSAV